MKNEVMTVEQFKEAVKESKKSRKNSEIKTRLMTREEKIRYGVQTSLVLFGLYN